MRAAAVLFAAAVASGVRAAQSPPAPPPDRAVPIAERVKGLERRDGFLPFYWDARKGALLLEISRWDSDFLHGSGLAGGAGIPEVFLDRGQIGELGLCRFTRVGPRVHLVRRQLAHRSGVPDRDRTRVVEESFPDAVLAALPIVAEDGETCLVDATDYLLRDPFVVRELRQLRSDPKESDWKQDVARSAPYLPRSGAFPRNTEIEVTLTFSSERPEPAVAAVLADGRTLSVRVHHTFLQLPPPGYAPRENDPRVGLFTVSFTDQTAPIEQPIERALITRWRLEKKDPSAKVSPPVAPLVYYLDRGIPEPEREAVKRAALWWNHAFEEAGFSNALVIEDLPEGASFLDARYPGIAWVNRAERGWSVGWSRTDPRTGEIVHAVALIDSHRRRTTDRMWRNLEAPRRDGACAAADGPDAPPGVVGSAEEARRLVLERLAYLSAHEVGHTLGLEHNWAATTFGWGSVMDYLAPHIELTRSGSDFSLSDAYPKDVGPYDKLAIAFAYTPSLTPAELDARIREAYAHGVVYPRESDPRWAEYDWGADPVAWLRTTQDVRREILRRFGPGQLRPGEPVHELQKRLSLAYLYHRFAIQAAQQHVGGQYHANAVAGDSQRPAEWVPGAKQKEALSLLLAAIAPEELDLPDRVLEALVGEPSGLPRSRERFASDAGDVFSPLTAARALVGLVVRPILSRQTAARLTLRGEQGALTLREVLRKLRAATFDAQAPAAPAGSRWPALQRAAQRGVLDAMLDLAADRQASPEVRAVLLAELTSLHAALKASRSADRETDAHLRLAERDVREFLEKPEVRQMRPAPVPVPPGRPIGG